MPKGIYIRKGGRTKSKLKNRIVCRKCFIVFFRKEEKNYAICPKCNRKISIRIRTKESKIYNQAHKDRLLKYIEYDKKHKKERGKRTYDRVKRVIFNIISNNESKCKSCNCDDIRLLEINHINGGGNKEFKRGKLSNVFYWDIYMGRRRVDDLELLCRVCNAKHYLELKYGKLPYYIGWGSIK